jgi:taurine dioxygenase
MIQTITLDELHADTVARFGVVRLEVGEALSPSDFLAVATRLGKPQPFALRKYRPEDFPPEVTLLDTHADPMNTAPRSFGEGWHQDSTFLDDPPAFTVLHAHAVPSRGGETLFSDTRPVLAALSAEERKAIATLSLEHAVRGTYRVSVNDLGRPIEDVLADLPRARHPLVFRHPRGGETLFLSPLYTRDDVAPELRPLWERLVAMIAAREVVHHWKVGEILVWDNRVVLHAATGYQGEERRRLLRTVIFDPMQSAA